MPRGPLNSRDFSDKWYCKLIQASKEYGSIKSRLVNNAEFTFLETKLQDKDIAEKSKLHRQDTVKTIYARYETLWEEAEELRKKWEPRQKLSEYCIHYKDYLHELQGYLDKPDNKILPHLMEMVRIWALSVVGDAVNDLKPGDISDFNDVEEGLLDGFNI